jgi:hypothetical protein
MEVQAIAAARLKSRAPVNSRCVSGASLMLLGSRVERWAQNGGSVIDCADDFSPGVHCRGKNCR